MSRDDARRAFAGAIAATAGVKSRALVEAFARVPREDFLGSGPWQIGRLTSPGRYETTPDADPVHLYQDVVVAIDPARSLNNGSPSALARWIDALDLEPGQTVAHIGCGTGYYSAILAELVGRAGRVQAWEVDAELAARSRSLLAPWPQVEVVTGDARTITGPVDAMLVNAGVTHAPPEWLAALAVGGRLVLPLTVHVPATSWAVGIMLRIDRPAAGGTWPARVVSPVGIYDSATARDPAREQQLIAIGLPLNPPPINAVRIDAHDASEACLAHADTFCLQR